LGQIENLRLFAHVVEQRSISKAAGKLGIAKSAVSRRLSLLEERFGVGLIDRAPGVWQVTEAGRELYQRALPVIGDVDDIESDFSEAGRKLAGPLSISVPRDFGLAYLETALIEFKLRYPEVQLIADFDDRQIDLSREDYDFAIRITAMLESDVVAKHLGTVRRQFYGSPTYVAQHGMPTQPNDLRTHAVLGYGMSPRKRVTLIDAAENIATVEYQVALNTNSGVFMREAALRGLGLTALPDFLAASAVERGDLVVVLEGWRLPDAGIYLVHSESRRLNRRMRLFSHEMAAFYQDRPLIEV
jgi:DNA-binding transcriptional LysR family regulator